MSRDNEPPFGRGETLYNGGTIDTNNLDGTQYEGMVKVFEDVLYSAVGIKPGRGVAAGKKVACRLMRNLSGITLFAKRLVQIDPASPGRILGNQVVNFGESYPVDEFLPAAGVPNGDLFFLVIGGPALVLTPMTGAEFISTSIAAGALIGAGTTNGGSTATGTTAPAGRGCGISIIALTTAAQFLDLSNICINYVGKAITAMTSGQTNADMLVDVRRPGLWL